jgi:hypothetical protein
LECVRNGAGVRRSLVVASDRKLPPIRGGTVCWRHGGNAPQVRRAATRRLAEAAVRRTLDEVEVSEIEDPVSTFAVLTSEALALKELLSERVASLGTDWTMSSEAGCSLPPR